MTAGPVDLMADTRGEVHARFPAGFSTGPLSRIPAGRPTQAGVEVILPEPQKPTALAAVSVTVRSSSTAQHRRSPNGTDNS